MKTIRFGVATMVAMLTVLVFGVYGVRPLLRMPRMKFLSVSALN